VVDRDTFLQLGWTPSKNYAPYVPDYEMTDNDWEQVEKFNRIIDAIYAKYWKTKYKTEIISMFRWLVTKDTLSDSKKAIYNKVLIYLFTIDKL